MRTLQEYLRLPYTIVLKRDDEGDFVARVDELPGCVTHDSNEAEALAALREAQEAWISQAIEHGDKIPEPAAPEPLPSGKWVQRVPRTLHLKLTKAARSEGVSLNHLVTTTLAHAMGAQEAKQALQGVHGPVSSVTSAGLSRPTPTGVPAHFQHLLGRGVDDSAAPGSN